jgi:hypothetical protein
MTKLIRRLFNSRYTGSLLIGFLLLIQVIVFVASIDELTEDQARYEVPRR